VTNASRSTGPLLLAVGDPLIALLPSGPDPLDDCQELRLYTGGAELNTAVGASRLGVSAAWLGRVGDDPLGRRIHHTLEKEGVATTLVVVDSQAPTGLYLREWLPDGVRRPYYYRSDGAGARLLASDWPEHWPASLPAPTLLHLTGITSALSDSAAAALPFMIEKARQVGASISVDPNFRPSLWPEPDRARDLLGALVRQADLVLLSEEDGQLLAGSDDPGRVVSAVDAGGHRAVVYKRGEKGAIAWWEGQCAEVPAYPVSRMVDPVGAGDGFNAGFLAAWLHGAPLSDCLQCGAWCGARAVEVLGEHDGYPTADQLPAHLRRLLAPVGAPVDRARDDARAEKAR
jgi:2-dehydro-3-deoxygluconokinase